MTKDGKIITCIFSSSIRGVIKQANELNIEREDIVSMFTLGGQVYLVYYS